MAKLNILQSRIGKALGLMILCGILSLTAFLNADEPTDTVVPCDYSNAGSPFITTWKTTEVKEKITIPTTGNSYCYIVDWGDGTSDTTSYTGDASHFEFF